MRANCWKGFQGQRSEVKVIFIQMYKCNNVRDVNFDGVASVLTCLDKNVAYNQLFFFLGHVDLTLALCARLSWLLVSFYVHIKSLHIIIIIIINMIA